MRPVRERMRNVATPSSSAVGDRAERFQLLAALLIAAAIGATFFLTGFWAGSAHGGSAPDARPEARPLPDWFLPIWDAYDRSPKVTPDTDFALLYETRPGRLARAAQAAMADAAKLRASDVAHGR